MTTGLVRERLSDPHAAPTTNSEELAAQKRARLAAILSREMSNAGLTISELARRTELAKGTVSNVMNGRTTPDISTLEAITLALQTAMDDALAEAGYNVRGSGLKQLMANSSFAKAMQAADELGTSISSFAALSDERRQALQTLLLALNMQQPSLS